MRSTGRATVGELASGALMPRVAALARHDGSVALVCSDPGSDTRTLLTALVGLGHFSLTDQTTVLDPMTLEVQDPAGAAAGRSLRGEPLEARLLIAAQYDPDAGDVHTSRLSGGEAAYLVGSRCARLDQVDGGPLPALARLARRVRAFQLRYSHAQRAAEEVTRLWQET